MIVVEVTVRKRVRVGLGLQAMMNRGGGQSIAASEVVPI
jgi:hypothetical protein